MLKALLAKHITPTAALLMGCFFFLSACENTPEEVAALTAKNVQIEEAKQIRTFLSQSGRIKARLTAPLMLRKPVGDSTFVEFPKTIHVDFFKDSSKVESTLDARYARYFENQSKVLLKDSVRVVNKLQGDTLITDELWWDQTTQLFTTQKPVQVRRKTMTIHGIGLDAAQDFSWYTFHKTNGILMVGNNSLLGTPASADTAASASTNKK